MAFATVPANRRLVVQQISAQLTVGGTITNSALSDGTTSVSGGYLPPRLYVLPQVQWTGLVPGLAQYVVNNSVVWYCEPSRTPVFSVGVNGGTGYVLADVTLTGYLVDLTK